jgi:predicted PurR-regulated permease PerM
VGIAFVKRAGTGYARTMDHAHIRAYFLAIVTTLLTILTVYMLRPFLVTVGLAAVFAVVLTPLHKALQRAKLPETPAAMISLLIGVICLGLVMSFAGVQLFKEAHSVYANLSQPGSVEQTQASISKFGYSLNPTFPGAGAYFDSIAANLSVYAQQILTWTFGQVGSVLSTTLGFILQFFAFIMTLYYLLREGPRLKVAMERYLPLTKEETNSLIARLIFTISSVVRGTLFVSVIFGVFTTLGFFVFGIPNSTLWGTVAVIASLIPSIGAGLVFVPGVLYLAFIGHMPQAIGLAIYALIGVNVIDYVVRPYLMGGSSQIHPLLILLSVFGGLLFFGPAGLFLGPLVISLLLGLLSIYNPSSRSEA